MAGRIISKEAWDLYRRQISKYTYGMGMPLGFTMYRHARPTKIIFSNDVTVCWFADGKKEMAKCTEFDRYSAEAGVAMCIAKHIFGSRNQFKKFVEAEYDKSIDHLAEKAKRNIKKQKKKELNTDGNND